MHILGGITNIYVSLHQRKGKKSASACRSLIHSCPAGTFFPTLAYIPYRTWTLLWLHHGLALDDIPRWLAGLLLGFVSRCTFYSTSSDRMLTGGGGAKE